MTPDPLLVAQKLAHADSNYLLAAAVAALAIVAIIAGRLLLSTLRAQVIKLDAQTAQIIILTEKVTAALTVSTEALKNSTARLEENTKAIVHCQTLKENHHQPRN